MATPIDRVMAALAAATEPTKVALPGSKKSVRVLPPMDWRQSAMDCIREGDFNGWARRVLVDDEREVKGKDGTVKVVGSNDPALFIEADLTMRQVQEFIENYSKAAGQSLGE